MASYNKIIIVGRLTRDPEMKYTGDGMAVAKFSVAVDRPKKKDAEKITDFFDVSCFRQTAEFVNQYVTKGRLVLVEGSINFNDGTAQDGTKRRYTNLVASNVNTLDTQKNQEGDGQGQGAAPQQGNQGNGQPPAQRPAAAAPPRQPPQNMYPEDADPFGGRDPFDGN